MSLSEQASEKGREHPECDKKDLAKPEEIQDVYLAPEDEAIVRLLAARTQKVKKPIQLPIDLIKVVQQKARPIFLEQPTLLELQPPINIVGDIHGHFHDLLTILEEGGYPPVSNYLFLGDYVDRGKFSLETLCLVLCFKIKFPNNFFMLRGNHECAMINRVYGFFDDCKRRYNIKLWKGFTDIFNCLPLGAVIDDRIFCVHAGLSPNLSTLDQLNTEVERPKEVLDHGLACDLLWADPEDGIKGFGCSERGVSFTFGADMIEKFLKKNNLDLIARAHQVFLSPNLPPQPPLAAPTHPAQRLRAHRSWRTGISSLRNASWSQSSRPQTTAVSLTTQVHSCTLRPT